MKRSTVCISTVRFCAVSVLVMGAVVQHTAMPAAAQGVGPPPATQPPSKAQRSLGKATAAPLGSDGTAKDPEKAQRSFDAGLLAYQAGRHDDALNQLNLAINGGGLSAPLMARALYYRGASFHAKGMPGQAISDLTSALWFKGGLDDRERAEATRTRVEAYRAAGLDSQGNATQTVAAASPKVSTEGPWAATPTSAGPAPQLSVVPTDTQGQSTGPGVDLGSILGGLFSGGTKPIETAALPRDPAEVAPSSQPVARAPEATADGREVLPWGAVAEPGRPITAPTSAEGVKPETAKPSAKTARPVAAAPPVPRTPTSAAVGIFRIQVGSAKSEAEANALAAKARDNPALVGAAVSVDPMAFGGTTFYRVRVGPYASAADTRGPCAALKTSGLDCLVTAQ